jgi:hypothetical protein
MVHSLPLTYLFCLHFLIVGVKGKIITSVQRDEKYFVILVKLLLRSIAMMDVPIENANSLTLSLSYLGSYSNIIKDAKSC